MTDADTQPTTKSKQKKRSMVNPAMIGFLESMRALANALDCALVDGFGLNNVYQTVPGVFPTNRHGRWSLTHTQPVGVDHPLFIQIKAEQTGVNTSEIALCVRVVYVPSKEKDGIPYTTSFDWRVVESTEHLKDLVSAAYKYIISMINIEVVSKTNRDGDKLHWVECSTPHELGKAVRLLKEYRPKRHYVISTDKYGVVQTNRLVETSISYSGRVVFNHYDERTHSLATIDGILDKIEAISHYAKFLDVNGCLQRGTVGDIYYTDHCELCGVFVVEREDGTCPSMHMSFVPLAHLGDAWSKLKK